MEADTYQLKQILTPERRYVIPTFQRDYEWTRDGQWQLLFEDLDAVATRLSVARTHAAAAGHSTVKAEKSVAPHFLGAVVCDQLPSPAGGLDLRAVIDGQQRLTTLQLLVRGVLDVLVADDSTRVRQVRRLLENPADVINDPKERHKLWPRRKDRDVWPIAMADAVPDPKTHGNHLYLQARRYFADQVRAVRTDTDGSDRIEHLVDALLDLFKLVVIDLDDNDDAQVIFEVLNGRQTPLSPSDLVKNLLFLRGEIADDGEIDTLYDTYWAEFDEDWWKVQVGTGHAARGRRDVLLSVWLTAASGKEASVGHLYGEVRSYLAAEDRKTEDLLSELHAYAQAYKAIYGGLPVSDPSLRTAYGRLVRLKITTAMPLLAWLRTLPTSRLTDEDHVRAVRAVESWVMRRMLEGGNTRGYGAAFLIVLKAAQKAAADADADIADAIVDALAAGPNSLPWPTDSQVRHAFLNDTVYNRFTQERIRMVLGAIDAHLQATNRKGEHATFDYGVLQIEHVMPQAWREHWPLPQGSDPTVALHRDTVVHRFGNLTLVTATFNQSVSNLGWAVKQPEFAEQSKLELNTPMAGATTWDESAIDARATALAEVACTVWPLPERLRTPAGS